MSILRDCAIDRVMTAQAASTSDTLSSDIVDTAGYDGVTFLFTLGDVANTAALTFRLQQNTANSTSGMATLVGAISVTAGASDYDNKVIVMEVYRPQERYLRAQIVRATANAAVDSVTAILWKGRNAPITQNSDVVQTDFRASPAEA